MINVGLLFDSVSNNVGDAAVGICLEEFCAKQNFKYEVVNPFKVSPQGYSTIIIGGGFLIREPGDEFYDAFRLEGDHILNGVGVAAKTDLEYLNEYRLVTVRSSKERRALKYAGVKDPRVVPCITTLMTGKPVDIRFSDSTLGVHLTADTLIHVPSIHDEILKLPHDKVYIPFTHYNEDRSFMSHLPEIEKHMLLDNLSHKELFYVIGKMKYLVTSSLHASIFAYLQNVPFLTIYQEKTFNYFSDRDMGDYLFYGKEDFPRKLRWLLETNHDFTENVIQDKKTIKAHLDQVAKIIIDQGKTDKKMPTKMKSQTDLLDKSLGVAELRTSQMRGAVLTRDRLLGGVLTESRKVKEEKDILKTQLKFANERLKRIESSITWRVRKKIRNMFNRP